MPELAYINGRFMPIEKAVVNVEDRGYQFGDAVYEFLESFNGHLFCLEEHLDRLENSLKSLYFPHVSRDKIRQATIEMLNKSGFDRTEIYIQISRGVQPREHAFGDDLEVQVVMTARDISNEVHEKIEKMAKVQTCRDFRWGLCNIKTVQLLPAVLALREASTKKLDDSIFISDEGVVREATSSNIFICRKNTVITHPLTSNILPGITCAVVLKLCNDLNIQTEERFYHTDELYAADEAFLTATVMGIMPISEIDGHSVADVNPGPLTVELSKVLNQRRCEVDFRL